jgi:hypothetical protein
LSTPSPGAVIHLRGRRCVVRAPVGPTIVAFCVARDFVCRGNASLPDGCWIDLFESPRFRGRFRRLPGPSIYANIRGAGSAASFGVRITSLIVGPAAWLQLYQLRNPERSSVWLMAGESVNDLAELVSADQIDSMRVFDRPPRKQDSGCASFASRPRSKIGVRPSKKTPARCPPARRALKKRRSPRSDQ